MTSDAPPHDADPWHLLGRSVRNVEVWRMTDEDITFLRLIRKVEGGFELLEAPTSPSWRGDPPRPTGETEDGEHFLYESDPRFLPEGTPIRPSNLPGWAWGDKAAIAAFTEGR